MENLVRILFFKNNNSEKYICFFENFGEIFYECLIFL